MHVVFIKCIFVFIHCKCLTAPQIFAFIKERDKVQVKISFCGINIMPQELSIAFNDKYNSNCLMTVL